MEPPKVETVMPPGQMMALVIVCVAALLVIFVVLALVRMWGQRMQKKHAPGGGLDVEALRRMRDAGEISPQEFDIILGGIAGSGGGAAAASAKTGSGEEQPPAQPIKNEENPPRRERSNTDG
jgi:hypothetical protein